MNIYNRKSTRFKDYDYNQPGYYFVTICTSGMQKIFGDISNYKMKLNSYGKIADKFWVEIPKHFESVGLDCFQIMPNHIHGIIIINPSDVEDAKFASSTTDRTKMLLSKIIQQFKRRVTIEIRSRFNYNNKIWQKSFYDRIIRNENELYKIRKYIMMNPFKWELKYVRNNNHEI